MDQPCRWRWESGYLGLESKQSEIDAAVRNAENLIVECVENPEEICRRMADLPTDSRVVGLYQGRSELGPRALRHRSILGDPRYRSVRDWTGLTRR
jgi:carbamoyltransferase